VASAKFSLPVIYAILKFLTMPEQMKFNFLDLVGSLNPWIDQLYKVEIDFAAVSGLSLEFLNHF
jgi:hypothetical protein